MLGSYQKKSTMWALIFMDFISTEFKRFQIEVLQKIIIYVSWVGSKNITIQFFSSSFLVQYEIFITVGPLLMKLYTTPPSILTSLVHIIMQNYPVIREWSEADWLYTLLCRKGSRQIYPSKRDQLKISSKWLRRDNISHIPIHSKVNAVLKSNLEPEPNYNLFWQNSS